MKSLFVFKPFVVMWLAMLTSMMGTFLLLLVLSAQLLTSHESSLLAGAVFAVNWLPAIMFYPLVGMICSRIAPKNLLVLVETVSGLLSILIGIWYQNGVVIILALLFIRGFFETTLKSTRMVALKLYIPEEYIEKASSIFNTSFYLGAGIGGLIGAGLVAHLSLWSIAAIDGLTFLFSAFLYAQLPELASSDNGELPVQRLGFNAWRKGYEALRANRYLLEHFFYLVVTTAVFQGYHSMARTVLPLSKFALGVTGVTIYQSVTCAALFLAAVVVYRFFCENPHPSNHPMTLIGVACLAMVSTIVPTGLIGGLFFYFIYIFMFEATYARCMNYIMVHCRKEDMPAVSAFIQSCMMTSMVINVVICSKGIDFFGITSAAYIMASLGFLSGVAIWLKVHHKTLAYGLAVIRRQGIRVALRPGLIAVPVE